MCVRARARGGGRRGNLQRFNQTKNTLKHPNTVLLTHYGTRTGSVVELAAGLLAAVSGLAAITTFCTALVTVTASSFFMDGKYKQLLSKGRVHRVEAEGQGA